MVQRRLKLIKSAIKLYIEPQNWDRHWWNLDTLNYRKNYRPRFSKGFSALEMKKWLQNLHKKIDFSKQLVIFYLKKLETLGYLFSEYERNYETQKYHNVYYLAHPWNKIVKYLKSSKVVGKYSDLESTPYHPHGLRGTATRIQILNLLREEEINGNIVSISHIVDRLNLSRRTIEYNLRWLLSIGFISRRLFVGDTRRFEYFLSEDYSYIDMKRTLQELIG